MLGGRLPETENKRICQTSSLVHFAEREDFACMSWLAVRKCLLREDSEGFLCPPRAPSHCAPYRLKNI